ncbi:MULTISPECIES: ABC transporter ATP-binding protein [unclassified Brenneria]|uniref:ABC transporter ATP-binding protein n=1 Tax=unclassified Brenneria TaxID=2634434 RepID=UPI001557EA5F|nr:MULTISPECIES: ABC transporter ATP-binding protein [unclassified Brenneria]MBJ7220353.1 ABC transporter ATP-binding protein [Brenneria sp. L3-3C-1]MEE3641598.1 ABC transporter ATP-binding protein [Brenneria sp. L3_3C_1]MEE3649771.1 ABC transporter ATP-binding protein [Brenneria sp. HEZEL_4_2_4]NPC99730.1 ABC transporter ATP-binding protein [Brenneria sp. hezel4-2-4]
MSVLLSINDLSVALPADADRPWALRHVSLELHSNEILCVVGESGSGKSMTASAIMGLLPDQVRPTAGSITFEGQDLLRLTENELRQLRGARIGMIFQDPMTALNPLHRVGDQIAEMFLTHQHGLSRREVNDKVRQLLADVHIPDPPSAERAYPHQLSGGQRQRVMIALALALEPRVLIADEPTTALDVTTQAQILQLIRELQQRKGTSVLFITHDFGVVADIADRVAVMQHGQLVEQGPASRVLYAPQHEYTRALIAAVPALHPATPRHAADNPPILTVKNIAKTFRQSGWLKRHQRQVNAVQDVSFALPQGSTLGIVGESGSGKSTLARCIVRLYRPDAGEILFADGDLAPMSGQALREQRRHIQMVFQDPFASLNPRQKVGEIVAKGLLIQGVSRDKAREKVEELFTLVGLDPAAIQRYPHEFSGGQRQRIGLARALAVEPRILVADEPVSALDVSVQAQVLALLAELRERLGLSLIFITHDLRVAAQVCDRIIVMKSGRIVEQGLTGQVFLQPRHDYTRQLLSAIPGREWQAPAA